MFTGIIKNIIKIKWNNNNSFYITSNDIYNLGDSIAVNGCCLTIDRIEIINNDNKNKNYKYHFTLSEKTVDICNFKEFCNIEPALKKNESLGGHIVSGHVDTNGIVSNIKQLKNSYVYTFRLDNIYLLNVTKKGSIAIDGISLTISDITINDCYFNINVNIIQHTWDNTIIKYYNLNDIVNIEFDHYNSKNIIKKEDIMKLAIEISETDKGYTLPNPWVGCIVTDKFNNIISTGYHVEYGKNHAEINALSKIKDIEKLSELNLYVTLEPCANKPMTSQTGSCAEHILKYKKIIKNIYIGIEDPNEIVKGNGVKLLKQYFNVEIGLCKEYVIESLKEYIYYNKFKRPYITGKISTSLNGVYAFKNNNRLIISGEKALEDCHKLRSSCSAILVGYNTFIKDKPLLNVRYNFKQCKNYKKIILCNKQFDHDEFNNYDDYIFININNFNSIDVFLKYLYDLKIVHLLIEGGNKTLLLFENYLNEFIQYTTSIFLDSKDKNYLTFNLCNKYIIKKIDHKDDFIKLTLQV